MPACPSMMLRRMPGLIYRVTGKQVVIYLVADGHRDMRALPSQLLLGG